MVAQMGGAFFVIFLLRHITGPPRTGNIPPPPDAFGIQSAIYKNKNK